MAMLSPGLNEEVRIFCIIWNKPLPQQIAIMSKYRILFLLLLVSSVQTATVSRFIAFCLQIKAAVPVHANN